jgi:hypothetical protein
MEVILGDIDLAIRTLPHAVKGDWQNAMHNLHTKPA